MASLSTAHQIDNVTPADSVKTGGDKINAHWHQYEGVLLTNSATGSTAVGDVLAVSTAGDSAAVLGDTVTSLQKYVVAMAIIANAATGEFARSGIVSAKAQGSIARGQYVKKSATARAVEDAGSAVGAAVTPPSGALGIAIAAAAGGFVLMLLFDQTYAASAASVLETGTWAVHGGAAADTVYQNTSGKKRRVAGYIEVVLNAINYGGLRVGTANPPDIPLQYFGMTTTGGPAATEVFGFGGEVPNGWYYDIKTVAGAITLDALKELDE